MITKPQSAPHLDNPIMLIYLVIRILWQHDHCLCCRDVPAHFHRWVRIGSTGWEAQSSIRGSPRIKLSHYEILSLYTNQTDWTLFPAWHVNLFKTQMNIKRVLMYVPNWYELIKIPTTIFKQHIPPGHHIFQLQKVYFVVYIRSLSY